MRVNQCFPSCLDYRSLPPTSKPRPMGYEDQYLETCTFKVSRKYYLGLFFADLVLFYVLPLLLSVILYILIAMILFTNEIPKTPGTGNKNGAVCSSDSKKTSSSNNARVQVVKMLVVVVAVFAIFWLPYRLLVVYNSVATERYMELWFLMFCKTMIFMNSAINPILYNAMSIKFRRAFKRMLSCNRRRPGQRNSRERNRTQTFYTSVATPGDPGATTAFPSTTPNNGHNKTSRLARTQQFSKELSPVAPTQQLELTSREDKTTASAESLSANNSSVAAE